MKEDRLKIWNDYTGPKSDKIRHNFVDYDRYYEAGLIEMSLQDIFDGTGGSFDGLKVLDFGCCAGDYGMYFARLGAFVHFEDIDEDAIKFVEYRLKREGLKRRFNHSEHDLAIFGEVLEHCDNALDIISDEVLKFETSYIFISSYPFRSDDENDPYWKGRDHSQQARLAQKAVRALLEKHYDAIKYDGERRLWIRK